MSLIHGNHKRAEAYWSARYKNACDDVRELRELLEYEANTLSRMSRCGDSINLDEIKRLARLLSRAEARQQFTYRRMIWFIKLSVDDQQLRSAEPSAIPTR